MNPLLPVCFMMAYAVALFCFMLVLCSTRSWPALAVLGAMLSFVFLFLLIILLTLCRGYAGLCTRVYARLAVLMLFAYAQMHFY